MAATVKEGVVQAFEIIKQEEIAAPIEIVFETILEQMGPLNSTPEKPMPMVLEAWPGGRWYRDLGDGNGHFWATVQAIKRPTLLEFCGPLFVIRRSGQDISTLVPTLANLRTLLENARAASSFEAQSTVNHFAARSACRRFSDDFSYATDPH